MNIFHLVLRNMEENNFDTLKTVLQENPNLIYSKNYNEDTLLTMVVQAHHNVCNFDIVKYLVDTGPELVNMPDDSGVTAINHLCMYGPYSYTLKIVNYLIDHGATLTNHSLELLSA